MRTRAATNHRAIFLLAAAIVVLGALPSSVVASGDAATDSAGVAVVGNEVFQSTPNNELQASVLEKAYQFASLHSEDVGYPWLDGQRGELRLAASSPRGRELLAANMAASEPTDIDIEIRDMPRSIAVLDTIREGVIAITQEKFPGSQFIAMTEPDEINERIVISLNAWSRAGEAIWYGAHSSARHPWFPPTGNHRRSRQRFKPLLRWSAHRPPFIRVFIRIRLGCIQWHLRHADRRTLRLEWRVGHDSRYIDGDGD